MGKRANLRRTLLGACTGMALFFAARWVFQQGRPERLRDLSLDLNPPLAIRREQLLTSDLESFRPLPLKHPTNKLRVGINGTDVVRMQSLPVKTGSLHVIGEDRRRGFIFQRLQLTSETLYYLAFPVAQAKVRTWKYKAPGSKTEFSNALSVAPASLMSLSLTGGAPVEVLPGIPLMVSGITQRAVGVVGENVYWIEIDIARQPLQACADLKMINRKTRSVQTLLSGISPHSFLMVEENNTDTVWVNVPAGPDGNSRGVDVYRIAVADNQPRLFIQNSENYYFRPVTYRGRVYWVRSLFSSATTRLHTEEIWSAALDGSDQKVICSTNSSQSATTLYVDRTGLYKDGLTSEPARPNRSNRVLTRLSPEAPNRSVEVLRFPLKAGQSFFDGGYVYFTEEEERENMWDWSPSGLRPASARVLNRFRLSRLP